MARRAGSRLEADEPPDPGSDWNEMNMNSGTGGTGRNLKLSPLALLALAVAVCVGVGLGAIGYRAWANRGDDAPAKPAPKVQAAVTEVAPGKPGLTRPAGDPNQENAKPGSAYPAQFSTESMFPRFHPDRRYYVSRCVPGKVEVQVKAKEGATVQVAGYPAETGRFMAEARALPGQAFTVTAAVDGKSTEYQVRCLPSDFPQWGYQRFADPPKGMYLISYRPQVPDFQDAWLIVFDQDGAPRWWLSPETNALGGQILADGTVQFPRGFGDGFGQDERTANEIRTLDGRLIRTVRFRGAPTDGHEYYRLPNGNAYIMSYKPRLGVDLTSVGGEKDEGVLDGAIQEVTPSGKVVWSWNSKDHVELSDIPDRWWKRVLVNPHVDPDGNSRYDIFHLNSIEPWGDQLVLSTRHTDRVWGISKKTGEVQWTFGGNDGPKSLRIEGEDPLKEYPLGGNHDARMNGDVLSIHDNGTHLDRPPRMLRYRIDLEDRTATFVGQDLDVKAAPTSHCCGGVRKLGTGWVVAWGNSPFITGFNADDEIAFRLAVSTPVYRAVPVPDSVTAEDLSRALDRMAPGIPPPDRPVRPIKYYDR